MTSFAFQNSLLACLNYRAETYCNIICTQQTRTQKVIIELSISRGYCAQKSFRIDSMQVFSTYLLRPNQTSSTYQKISIH